MADLTVVASTVKPVQVLEQFTGPAAVAITAGQYVRFDTATGKITLGNAANAGNAREGGLALQSVGAGEALTAVRQGILNMGEALAALTFDQDVFLSNNSGALADAAGTVSRVVGQVVPGWAATSADKLLRVDL